MDVGLTVYNVILIAFTLPVTTFSVVALVLADDVLVVSLVLVTV